MAIEGETDFDERITKAFGGNPSFDKRIAYKWPFLARAYMEHSVYPDGSSFEDALDAAEPLAP